MFDPHWHARDFESQSHKETIVHSLEVAYASGLDAIAAMPNTNPPLTNVGLCREYLSIADDVGLPVKFYVHIGLTSNPEQIKGAVQAWREEPGIIGMKAYWGRSTGDLSIVELEDQKRTIATLAECGYDGVLVSHCEKESVMDDAAYNPEKPRTWSTDARPEEAEVESFKDILRAARDYKFQGTIHVAHVSTTRVVDLIQGYSKINPDVKLSCGVTPHHLFLDYTHLDGEDGAWYKCNPPLRSLETQQGLLERLKDGRIGIIESDHAPHTEEDKSKEVPASGLASGTSWPYVSAALMSMGMSDQQILEVTFNNAKKLYGGRTAELQASNRETDFKRLKELQGDYPHDPFAFLK